MHSAEYVRLSSSWRNWLGKTGKVLSCTYIRTAGVGLNQVAPYSFAIVEFGRHKLELMGVGHEKLRIGDRVECVVRKGARVSGVGPLEYQLKIKKIIDN